VHTWAASLYSAPDPCPCSRCPGVAALPLVSPARLDSAMLVSCLPSLVSYTQGSRAPALCGKRPERSASSVPLPCPRGQYPRGPMDSLLEELEVRFPKVQDPDFTLPLTLIPQDCKLHLCMIPAARTASRLGTTDELTRVGAQQVQYRIPSGRAVCYQPEEVLLHALQESRGLPTALRAVFPQMWGWLESLSRSRACEHEASWSRRKQAPSVGSPDRTAWSRHPPQGSLCSLGLQFLP